MTVPMRPPKSNLTKPKQAVGNPVEKAGARGLDRRELLLTDALTLDTSSLISCPARNLATRGRGCGEKEITIFELVRSPRQRLGGCRRVGRFWADRCADGGLKVGIIRAGTEPVKLRWSGKYNVSTVL